MLKKVKETITEEAGEEVFLERVKEIPERIKEKFPRFEIDSITISVEVSATVLLSKGVVEVTLKKKE